jgi:hypothetical protein
MRLLNADWLIFRWSAALEKLPVLAKLTKSSNQPNSMPFSALPLSE